MKKLFAVIALFFAFTIGASAQETQKSDIFALAKQDAAELTSALKLNNEAIRVQTNWMNSKIENLNT